MGMTRIEPWKRNLKIYPTRLMRTSSLITRWFVDFIEENLSSKLYEFSPTLKFSLRETINARFFVILARSCVYNLESGKLGKRRKDGC